MQALIGIPLAVLMITSPIWLFILWRRRGRHRWAAVGQAYREGRTDGMTPAQLEAYQNDPGFVARHYRLIIGAGLIALVIMVPYLSLPVLALFCARAWNLSRQMKKELDEDEPRSGVRAERPGNTLGLDR